MYENPYKRQTVEFLLKTLRKKCPFNDTECFLLDNDDFALFGHRVRIFPITVDLRSCRLLKPVHRWADDLNNMVQQFRFMDKRTVRTVTSILLSEDDPEIVELRRCMEQAAEKNGEQAATSRIFEWETEHEEVRRTLRVEHLLDVPDVDEMIASLPGWAQLLPRREADSLGLHSFVCLKVLGIDVTKVRYVWDLTLPLLPIHVLCFCVFAAQERSDVTVICLAPLWAHHHAVLRLNVRGGRSGDGGGDGWAWLG